MCEALEARNLLSLFAGESQVNAREVNDQYASVGWVSHAGRDAGAPPAQESPNAG
jgi:hypothetical protein